MSDGALGAVRDWLAWHSIRAHIVAPIWVRSPEKVRWRIVHWLNRSRRLCWSDLVDAALARGKEDDPCDVHTPLGSGSQRCRTVCGWAHPDHAGEHSCSCYCGKFQFTAAEGSAWSREQEARRG